MKKLTKYFILIPLICFCLSAALLHKFSGIMRDRFILPLNNVSTQKEELLVRAEAANVIEQMKNITYKDLPKNLWEKVGQYFQIFDENIPVQSGNDIIDVHIRRLESKTPIKGKSIGCIILSFYGHNRITNSSSTTPLIQNWKPHSATEQSLIPIQIIQALFEKGTILDSLIVTSMGSTTISGFSTLTEQQQKLIPASIIINRGLSSTTKAIKSLFSFPFNHLLSLTAHTSGWFTDPENALLSFLQKHPTTEDHTRRKVLLIEAEKDYYFSGKSGFSTNFHHELANLEIDAFRGKFSPTTFHARAHHGAPLDQIINNSVATIEVETAMQMEPYESIASAIANKIFLQEGKNKHTCLYVGGNMEDVNIATLSVCPILFSLLP